MLGPEVRRGDRARSRAPGGAPAPHCSAPPSAPAATATNLRSGFLRHQRVRPPTQRTYTSAFENLKTWAAARRLPPSSHSDWDKALVAFMEDHFRRGDHPHVGRSALHATAWVQDLSTRNPKVFSLSRLTLAGWSKADPERARDPAPLEAVLVLVGYVLGALRCAREHPGRRGVSHRLRLLLSPRSSSSSSAAVCHAAVEAAVHALGAR